MSAGRRIRPILGLDRFSSIDVLLRAWAIYNGLGSDPQRYPSPTPTLSDLKGQIDVFENAEQAAGARTVGAVAVRNLERSKLVGMLEGERFYVQSRCDMVPREEAIVMVTTAGMFVASWAAYTKAMLTARPGPAAGTVILDANVSQLVGAQSRRCLFHWQWTLDGGQTFIDAMPTLVGKTVIAQLPSNATVGFRVTTSHKGVLGEWTQLVTALVP